MDFIIFALICVLFTFTALNCILYGMMAVVADNPIFREQIQKLELASTIKLRKLVNQCRWGIIVGWLGGVTLLAATVF